MTRQEIQQWCIEEYDILIKKYGEDHIYMRAPVTGKSTWTLKELRESVVNDTNPEGCDVNDIDLIIRYLEYCVEKGYEVKLEHTKL